MIRTFRHQRAVWASLSLAATVAACTDGTTPTKLLAPSALAFAAGTGGQFEDFTPISGSAVCVAPPSTAAGFASYQPFVLPSGFKQTILATEIADFRPVAGAGADLPDMMVLNETGPEAGRYLYRTHEVGSNGAVTVTDLRTGTTSLVDQQSHYEALDGIVWTPWHTLLFAEERIVASFRDPRVPNAVGGLVYEYDPRTGAITPRPAVGARSHEGLRFDAQGNLYGISESTPGQNGSGGIYKFTPDRRGDLSSGQLYVLKVLNASRTGEAVWVPLDRQAVQVNSDAPAIAAGATGWGRPEDIAISTSNSSTKGGNIMYVTSTSEDLVLRIELNGDEAYVSNFVQEGVNVSGLNNPDNLALDHQGNVYVLEDNGPGDIFIARVRSGNERVAQDVTLFASLSDCAGEPTGLYFDRTGKTAWVHIQHAGGTLQNDLLVAIAKE
jgi:uncharacterized protein